MLFFNRQKLQNKFPLYKFKIFGNSMSPALKNGEIVLVNRLAFLFRDPQMNDIVAVKDPRDQKILIKRITKKENGKYFVTGDNKLHSTDSRKFGMLEKKDIVGKVIL